MEKPSVDSSAENTPVTPKVAWGGAGMTRLDHKRGLPSQKSRDNSIFSAIQSEDLARELDHTETMKVYNAQRQCFGDESDLGASTSKDVHISTEEIDSNDAQDVDTLSDRLIAQMIQYDQDVLHDMELDSREKQINKSSKVNIIFSNHRILPSIQKDRPPELPWENIPVDDIEAQDHLMPITSYNQGKKKKSFKHDKAERSTMGSHIDATAATDVVNLLARGALKDVGGIISAGKEAMVYHAKGGAIETKEFPELCVLKMFRTRLTEFKNRESYIKEDHRFTNRLTKTNTYKNIVLWVEKEMRNLKRLHHAGVPCPEPLYSTGSVIVMSLIGDSTLTAPQLRLADMPQSAWTNAYKQTIEIMDTMINKCRLVHGDLSEYNLLYYYGRVHVIDLAQAVDLAHPNSLGFLYRDCCNIANFFHKKGVDDVMNGVQMLQHVTKLDLKNSLSERDMIEDFEKELNMWRGSDCYNDAVFEFLWNESQLRDPLTKRLAAQNNDVDTECYKTGSSQKEQWITKRTDSAVIKNNKKRRNRKNSSSKSDKNPEEHQAEVEGFCVVDSSDCVPVSGEGEGRTDTNNRKKSQKVRFDDTDTAADTEDYNADADTDEMDTTDIDTDVNAPEDCDTEGYQGDADDTDNNVSDFSSLPVKDDDDANSEGADEPTDPRLFHRSVAPRWTRTPQPQTKRNAKKRNKKSKDKK